jgi:integrase
MSTSKLPKARKVCRGVTEDWHLPEDLKRWRRGRLEEDRVKPATVNRTMAFMRKVLYHAMDNGYVSENVVTKLGRRRKSSAMLPEENERDVYLSYAEEDALQEKFEPQEWHKVQLAIHTGLRESNLFGMRRSWVDFRTHTIRDPGRPVQETARPRRQDEPTGSRTSYARSSRPTPANGSSRPGGGPIVPSRPAPG